MPNSPAPALIFAVVVMLVVILIAICIWPYVLLGLPAVLLGFAAVVRALTGHSGGHGPDRLA